MRQTASASYACDLEGARMEQQDEQPAGPARKGAASHRASYLLEFGTWKAVCKTCGWTVRDPQRRQAASRFRMHIRDARIIDLGDPAGLEAGLAAMGVDMTEEPKLSRPAAGSARYAAPDDLLWGAGNGIAETPASRPMRAVR